MKILVICQHYWPEPFPLTNICEELSMLGHDVHVVTDVPNYPMGYIYPDYKFGKNRDQFHNGVKISRVYTVGRRNNIVFRMLNYFSYAISSTLFVKKLDPDYDVVFTVQASPVMMVNAAMTYAKKNHKKTVLYSMDLWPASLKVGGIKEKSLIYNVFYRISKKLYRKADRILITSQMFREYFKEQFGISDELIRYLPQYADNLFEKDFLHYQKEKKDTIDLVFAGNIGAAQSISTILNAAKLLEYRKELRWHIVGDGSELENMKRLAKKLDLENVIFHGRKPFADMPKYYNMADAMLATLTSDPVISLTLPAKILSYMAAGKPIIASADGEISQVIAESKCGFCGKADDPRAFADAVCSFLAFDNKEQLSENSWNYYKMHFTKELFMRKLEEELKNHSERL